MYSRPTSIKEVKQQMTYALNVPVPVEGHRHRLTVQTAARSLIDNGWVDDALAPLYEANTLVSFLTNTITPHLVQLIDDERLLTESLNNALKDRRTFDSQCAMFERIFKKIEAACLDARTRDAQQTEEFKKMRDSMYMFVTTTEVYNGFKIMYVSIDKARLILDLMTDRLTIALQEHDDIMSSTDIPLKAMALS